MLTLNSLTRIRVKGVMAGQGADFHKALSSTYGGGEYQLFDCEFLFCNNQNNKFQFS